MHLQGRVGEQLRERQSVLWCESAESKALPAAFVVSCGAELNGVCCSDQSVCASRLLLQGAVTRQASTATGVSCQLCTALV